LLCRDLKQRESEDFDNVRQEFNQASEEQTPGTFDVTTQQGTFPGSVLDEDVVGRIVRFIKKRAWLVCAALLLGLLGGVLTNRLLGKLYTAQSTIEVQTQDARSQFRLEQVQDLGAIEDASEKLDTEIEILKSRNLALETIQALHLESNPDFLPLVNGHPYDLSQPDIRHSLISVFSEGLAVSRLGHTSIIRIAITSKQPYLATLIANTLVDRYIERSFHESYTATYKVSTWLDSKLSTMKANLEKSQARILQLRRDLGLYGLDPNHSIIAANLEELNKQYADAQVDRLMKEARVQQIQTAPPDVIDAALGGLDPNLQALKQRLVQLNSDYAALSQTYGSGYPRVKSLKAQIDLVKQQLNVGETAQLARSQKELDAAKSNEDKLRGAFENQEQEAFGKGEQSIQYELARQDYETNRMLYDGLQQRLQEASIMSGLHSTAIHVVDNADTPVYPSRPRSRVNLALGAGLGLILGISLAVIFEAMDTNLKTIGEIEQGLQLPLLAAIPSVDAEHLLPAKFREHAVTRGGSAWSKIAESLRGMRTSILLSSPGSPPKVIMIASTRPAEGKSSVAALTAITFALNGAKILLIDADLRRPAIHMRFKVGKGLGLSSVLSGKASLHEAVAAWPDLPNLHLLSSGPVPPLPSELLGSRQMEDLLKQTRQEYDFVIMDTPPVLAVTDASILGRLADAIILILRFGSAKKQVVLRCLDLLERSGSHVLGVAVNFVDFQAPEYEEYYGRKYYDYYGEREAE
jgi:polysaccharide biosynthesis transport protein